VYDVDTAEEAWERLAAWKERWWEREPQAVANFCADFQDTIHFLDVPREHRQWVTTSNPVERHIRELRRRLRPMGVLQGPRSANVLVYVAVKKTAHPTKAYLVSWRPLILSLKNSGSRNP
jgi:putative transposase